MNGAIFGEDDTELPSMPFIRNKSRSKKARSRSKKSKKIN